MKDESDRIAAATTIVKAAFKPNATTAEMAQGEHVLSSLLAALRGAMSARPQAASAAPKGETPPSPATSPSATPATTGPTAGSQMLDTVIHFLKEQLDDEDRAAIEAQAPPFSVPFINNLQGV